MNVIDTEKGIPDQVEGGMDDDNNNAKEKSMTYFFLVRLRIALILIGIFVAAFLIVKYALKEEVIDILEWARTSQPASVVYCGLFLALWVMCFLPQTIVSMGLGYVFGFWWGLLSTKIGMLVGMVLTIIMVRTLFEKLGWRQRLRSHLLDNYIEVRVLNSLLATEPYKAIALVKLSFLPTWLKTYSLAVLDAPWKIHIFVGFWSSLVYSVMFVYFGSIAKDVVDAINSGRGLSTGSIVINVFGVIMTIVVIVYLRYKVKLEINKQIELTN